MKTTRIILGRSLSYLLAAVTMIVILSGCARYARNINMLYEPSATVRSGSGNIYMVIPENQQTPSPEVKWVLGQVKDDENKKIDEIYSPRSSAEIILSAFSQEFKASGYTVIPTTKRPTDGQRIIELTKSVIDIEQVTDLADLKATCRIVMGIDVVVNGQLIKKLQYEAVSSKTDIKDRDLLARIVLQDAMQTIMLKAVPELHDLLSRK